MSKKIINKTIIDNDKVIKERNDKVISLYDYLDSRGFDQHPNIININDGFIESEYIKSYNKYEIIEGVDFIKTVATLHSKTMEYKSVSKNKYRKVYDKIIGNIEYLKKYYENIISNIEDEVFMSPSHYLLIRNYSVIDGALKYGKNNIKKWFKLVSNKTKERVCIVHNNLSFDHFIRGDKNYLTSFDNYLVDTPVLDLYTFYKKEGFKLNFNELLKEYNKINELTQDEKLLLNVLISIPIKITEVEDEYLNCLNIRDSLNYLYSCMNIINENK